MTTANWGATPGEWQGLCDWGITQDLLPVVSNPKAIISPTSKMKDLGKTPSRYNSQRHVTGILEWTRRLTNEREVAGWLKEPDLGICVQTRLVRAIDIDIDDPEVARKVRDCVEMLVGDLPMRFRKDSGKCLLAFKMEGQFTKRIIRADKGIIEFLANGQQFIAAGTHPKGARYEWAGGIPDDVPYLTAAEFETVWQALVDTFAVSASEARAGVRPSVRREAVDADDDVLDFLERMGWVRAFDQQGRAHIRCPWEHEHTNQSDEDDTSTSYFPRGVGGFEQGHFNCMHAHCNHRTDGDFLEATGYASEDFAVVVAPAVDKERALRNAVVDTFTREIESTDDVLDLEERVGLRISRNDTISATQREILTQRMRDRAKALGSPISISIIRNWLAPRSNGGGFEDVGDSGEVRATLENFRALMKRMNIVLRYNVIRKDVDILVPDVSLSNDNRDNAARAYILSECERVGMPTRHVDSYLVAVADENQYNPVMAWVESRPWDGRSRLQELYDTVVSDAPHKEMVMRKWLITCMAAASSPDGISAQGVLTFQGAQNKGKSTWFRRLTPGHLDVFKGEYALKVQDKDSVLTAMGFWIVELGELDATFSKSELSNLKNFVTNSTDKLRRPYAARDSKMARRTVFCATVNPPEFLRDPTGNRRFWCLPVKGFVHDHRVDMQQLWAEVYELVKGGEKWALSSKELDIVNVQNEQFVEVGGWMEKLAVSYDWAANRAQWRRMAPSEVAAQCGNQSPNSGVSRDVAAALRKLSGEHVAMHAGVKFYMVPPFGSNAQDFADLA